MCFFCEMNAVTKQFKTFSQKWGNDQDFGTTGGVVTYNFANENVAGQFGTFDSFITDVNFQNEIHTSLSSWESVADIRFAVSSDSSTADIRFGWRDIDGKGGVLGQTTVPSSGALQDVVIALDMNEDWFLSGDSPPDKIDFSSTVTHEIGHAIGLDHSETQSALMNANYSTSIFSLQTDDIDGALAIYGDNNITRIDVHRFYNPESGGHFFTADSKEKDAVDQSNIFNAEGVGFDALSRTDDDVNGSIPVYRFFNPRLGSHFFTAFEKEKEAVQVLEDFIFEGVGFRAFESDTSSTVPVFRFFNAKTGGHFFTASEIEKRVIIDNLQLTFEGEAFYAFADLNI